MTPDQVITLILGIIGGGGLGAILTAVLLHRRERNKPAVDSADVTAKLYATTIAQLDQMQKDVERLRGERDTALKAAHEWEKQYDIETERHESTKAFNKLIEAKATEAGQAAREWHERAILAEGELKAMQVEAIGLRQRVIEEKAGVAALGVELMRQQTGPLNTVKVNDVTK